MESASKTLVKRLRTLREEAGLTQEAMAEKIAMPYKAYQHIESGRRSNPRLSTLEKLAGGLGVGIVELFSQPAKGHSDSFAGKRKKG